MDSYDYSAGVPMTKKKAKTWRFQGTGRKNQIGGPGVKNQGGSKKRGVQEHCEQKRFKKRSPHLTQRKGPVYPFRGRWGEGLLGKVSRSTHNAFGGGGRIDEKSTKEKFLTAE